MDCIEKGRMEKLEPRDEYSEDRVMQIGRDGGKHREMTYGNKKGHPVLCGS